VGGGMGGEIQCVWKGREHGRAADDCSVFGRGAGVWEGVSGGRGNTPEGDTDSSAASNSSSQALWNVMKHDPP
jgi:hypothetical protein